MYMLAISNSSPLVPSLYFHSQKSNCLTLFQSDLLPGPCAVDHSLPFESPFYLASDSFLYYTSFFTGVF